MSGITKEELNVSLKRIEAVFIQKEAKRQELISKRDAVNQAINKIGVELTKLQGEARAVDSLLGRIVEGEDGKKPKKVIPGKRK